MIAIVAAITTSRSTIITTIMTELTGLTPFPVTKKCHAWTKAPGNEEMMLTVMIIDVPLPIPFSVIWSAIHSRRTVPATMVITVRTIQAMEGSGTRLPKRSIPFI